MKRIHSPAPFLLSPDERNAPKSGGFSLYGIQSGMTRSEIVADLDLKNAVLRARRYASEEDIESMIIEWLRSGVPTQYVQRLEQKKAATLILHFDDQDRLWKLAVRYWRPHADSGLLDKAFHEALLEAFPNGAIARESSDGEPSWVVTFIDEGLERESIGRLKAVYREAILKEENANSPKEGHPVKRGAPDRHGFLTEIRGRDH